MESRNTFGPEEGAWDGRGEDAGPSVEERFVDENGRVSRRLLCRQCAYDLRGVMATGVCPECGYPASQSLRGDVLEAATPEYLAKLRSGILLIVVGMIAAGVLQLVMGGVSLGAVLRTMGKATPANFNWLQLLSAGLGVVPMGMLFYGYLQFTEGEAGRVESETPRNARRVLRTSALLLIILTAVSAVLLSLGYGSLGSKDIVGMVAQGVVGFVGAVVWCVLFFASVNYSMWLSKRASDPVLFQQLKKSRWLLPIIYIVGSCIVIGPLVSMLWYAVLLWRLRTRIGMVAAAVAYGER
jgi:hypothetical protein